MVLLLHGLAKTGSSMSGLARHLRREGFDVFLHTYPSRAHDVRELARRVSEAVAKEVPDRTLFAVTHSLGGVLVRHMQGLLPIERCVMLAPPNQGSRVGLAFAGHPLYRWFYGPAGLDVAHPELWPMPPCRFAVIAGTSAISVASPISWVTRSFGILPAGEPSDGTVTVAETRLQGMDDFATVDASHSWIMDHAETRRFTVNYLRTGKF